MTVFFGSHAFLADMDKRTWEVVASGLQKANRPYLLFQTVALFKNFCILYKRYESGTQPFNQQTILCLFAIRLDCIRASAKKHDDGRTGPPESSIQLTNLTGRQLHYCHGQYQPEGS